MDAARGGTMTIKVTKIERTPNGGLALHTQPSRWIAGLVPATHVIEIDPLQARDLLAALIGSVDTATLKRLIDGWVP